MHGTSLFRDVFALTLALSTPPANIYAFRLTTIAISAKSRRHHRPFSYASIDNQRRNSCAPIDITITALHLATDDECDEYDHEHSRRSYVKNTLIGAVCFPAITNAADKEGLQTFQKGKSRNEGYSVQKSKSEWVTSLSQTQFNVLRRGGTERQRGSILEKEKRPGTFVCAGCDQSLFSSTDKFDSGTGWPSFESAINSEAVEIEEVGWMQSVDGAEVRCRTCGGHLGDVFGDGWRYGSKSGKRYCINGAALVFRPMDGGKELRGDIPPPNKVIEYEPLVRKDA